MTVKGKLVPLKPVDKPASKDLLASEIRALRQRKGLSVEAFARSIGVSHMTVYRWETGANHLFKPSHLSALVDMAPQERKWLFLERLGISRDQLIEGAKASGSPINVEMSVSAPSSASAAKLEKRRDDLIAVGVLRDAAAAGQPRFINEKDIESFILVPNSKEFAPHPSSLIAVKIKGDSMSPFLDDGYIAVIDTAETSRKSLYNEMVAARDPDGGVTIKWLRNNGKEEILMPQHTAIRHQPVIISGNDDWKIIGKVVWWVGKPPPK
jgi:transcriptional regulator with XRE-family HTH domain